MYVQVNAFFTKVSISWLSHYMTHRFLYILHIFLLATVVEGGVLRCGILFSKCIATQIKSHIS